MLELLLIFYQLKFLFYLFYAQRIFRTGICSLFFLIFFQKKTISLFLNHECPYHLPLSKGSFSRAEQLMGKRQWIFHTDNIPPAKQKSICELRSNPTPPDDDNNDCGICGGWHKVKQLHLTGFSQPESPGSKFHVFLLLSVSLSGRIYGNIPQKT